MSHPRDAHGAWTYSKLARVYDALFAAFFSPRLALAIRAMNIAPGERVLDLGVGTGLSLEHYPAGARVTAVDLSQHMLRECRRRIERLGLSNVELVQADASHLDFEDATFDYVLAGFFMTVVDDPRAVMCEIARVVKPDGQVVLVNHFRSDNQFLGQVEDILSPLCRRLGWYSDVRFRDVFCNGTFQIVSRRRMWHIDLWEIVTGSRSPEKSAGPGSGK